MAGYSKTPLIRKLGIKGGRTAFLSMPASVRKEIGTLFENAEAASTLGGGRFDFIHYFAENEADLRQIMPRLKQALDLEGMLWISWRKGRVRTDLTEDTVRKLALEFGLVDVKVCAVDAVWSALKLVYRVKDRQR